MRQAQDETVPGESTLPWKELFKIHPHTNKYAPWKNDNMGKMWKLTRDNKIRPTGRVLHMDPLDTQIRRVLGIEQHRPQVRIVRVEDLVARELVPPPLPVPVEGALAEDAHPAAAPLPEHDGVLERVRERRALPVRRVVGEADLPVQPHLHVVQEGQVQRPADDEGLARREVQRPAVVGLLQGGPEGRRDVVRVVAAGPDGHDGPAVVAIGRAVRVFLSELGHGAGDSWREGVDCCRREGGCPEEGRGSGDLHGGRCWVLFSP